MRVLVLGGAGYIGSHTVRRLLNLHKHEVIVVDSLQTGHRTAVDAGATFYQGDIRDSAFLDAVFTEHAIDVVIHFAANSVVSESMNDPAMYYDNNLGGAISLVKTMKKHSVKAIVFSSTAAVYGEPAHIPIVETEPTSPTNPYGETKLAMEQLFHWADIAYGIKYISLRYFNAAGADAKGDIGEAHRVETHLIPLVLRVALGQKESVAVYGTDYPTKDGTCVRDYIHVYDLADAHILAVKQLLQNGSSDIYNLGSNMGFTVREVINTARKITGHAIPIKESPKRPGDPARLIASSNKAQADLGWDPAHKGLEPIIESAWRWHSTHPRGYREDET